jgi:hypothetical protein
MASHIEPPYIVGALLAVAGFAAVSLVPDAGVVLLLVGAMPFLARFTPGAKIAAQALGSNRPKG